MGYRERIGRRWWVVITILLLASWRGAGAAQQEAPLQAQSAATYTFGQSMHFSLRVKSAADIVAATLFFNTPAMDGTYTMEFEFEPAKEVVVDHELLLTQVPLAPFTEVRFWWRVTTTSGTQHVAEQTLDYVDDRFVWQAQAAEGIEVYWTGSEQTLGQTALDVIARARTNIESVLPGDAAPLRVFIYPSMADLRSALRLTGRDWVGAEAMPELGLVLVTSVNPRTAALDLGQSIPHELSHLMMYRIMGAQYEHTPRWLDEGLATRFQLSQDAGQHALLQQALEGQGTIPFAELCQQFPAAEAQARLAYAQSAGLVAYLQQQYGLQSLRDLVQAYADGAGCEGGVQRVYGKSLQTLESEWLARERPAPPLLQFLRLNGLWVALAGGSFMIMGLLLAPLRKTR